MSIVTCGRIFMQSEQRVNFEWNPEFRLAFKVLDKHNRNFINYKIYITILHFCHFASPSSSITSSIKYSEAAMISCFKRLMDTFIFQTGKLIHLGFGGFFCAVLFWFWGLMEAHKYIFATTSKIPKALVSSSGHFIIVMTMLVVVLICQCIHQYFMAFVSVPSSFLVITQLTLEF